MGFIPITITLEMLEIRKTRTGWLARVRVKFLV